MYIVQIYFGTPEYDEAVSLRYEVLRKPLGLQYDPEQLAQEYDQIHIGAYSEQRELLGYLNLTPIEDNRIKMRQVAVRPDVQGKGIGKVMVSASEALAKAENFNEMVLHARESAVPFYLSLGYTIQGERFEEVTIPHFKMCKSLQ